MALKFVIPMVSILAMSACAGITAAPPRTLPTDAEFSNSLLSIPSTFESAYYTAGADKFGEADKFLSKRFAQIDEQFTYFLASLTTDKNSTDIITELAVLGLTGAIATGLKPQTAQSLGAYSAIITGGKAAYDQSVFINETLGILKTQMINRRDIVRERVVNRLAALSGGEPYPLFVMQRDVQDYYHAGTIRGAIDQATNDAGESAREAELQKDLVAFTDQGTELIEYLTGGTKGGDPLAAPLAKLNACAASESIAGWTNITPNPIGRVRMVSLARKVSRSIERGKLHQCLRNQGEL